MEDFLKWYVDRLDDQRLNKLTRVLNFNIPGFSKSLSKAPAQLLKKKTLGYLTDTPRDKLTIYVEILNESLHDETAEIEAAEMMDLDNEATLIEEYGLDDYLLMLLAKTGEDDDGNAIEHVRELISNVAKADCVPEDEDGSRCPVEKDVSEDNVHSAKEVKNLEKRLQNKINQLERNSTQMQKLKAAFKKMEEKYKKQLGDINKAYQKAGAELDRVKEALEKVEGEKKNLEQQVEKLSIKSTELKKQLTEGELALKAWQAKYPGEDLFSSTLRVIIIGGHRPERKFSFISGVMVDKTVIDLVGAEEMCANGNPANYDLGFLLPSRCTHEQRLKILKKFISCRIQLSEIPNMKNSESIIQKKVKEIIA